MDVGQSVGAENQAKDFLQGDEQTDGGNQGDVRRAIQDGLVAETVDEHAHRAPPSRQPEGMARIRLPVALVSRQPQIAAQGKKTGMGHVQDAQQPVNQGQADGDDGVHAAVYQALNEQFKVQQSAT